MLMLEVAPHVLMPVHPLFRDADRAAHRHRNNNWFGKAVWALTRTPASLARSVVTLGRGVASGWKLLTAGNSGALAEGPAFSVRELGADEEASLFQDMDINRYLKSIEDRVNAGVRLALREASTTRPTSSSRRSSTSVRAVCSSSPRRTARSVSATTTTSDAPARRPRPSPAAPGAKKGPAGGKAPGAAKSPGTGNGPAAAPGPQRKAGEK